MKKYILPNRIIQTFLRLYTNPEARIVAEATKAEWKRLSDIYLTALKNANNPAKSSSASAPSASTVTTAQSESTSTKSENKVKSSFVGRANDGKGIYKSNFPIGTPKSAKSDRILDYITKVWSKEPISLVISNGQKSRTILAQFDPTVDETQNNPTDASKIAGGNRHGNHTEQRVTLDLADDYYQIASEAKYNYSKEETGKETATHLDAKMWHYFVNDIYFSEYGEDKLTPYTVTVNVKEKTDGSFVYSYNAEKTKEPSTRQTLHAAVNARKGANGELFIDSIPENEKKVKHSEKKIKSSFAGTLAATADKMKLSNAERMLSDGYDSETVRKETGWFKGYDGKWRFEIDDSEAEVAFNGKFSRDPDIRRYAELVDKVYFSDTATQEEQNELSTLDKKIGDRNITPDKLGDLLNHPALFEAYPKLADIDVYFAEGTDTASYHPGFKEIAMPKSLKMNSKKFKETLLHEVQHAVQDIEGFAGGSNVEMFNNSEGQSAFSQYKNTAGEVEARDVSARNNLTAEQRKNTRPDIDRTDVIFAEGRVKNSFSGYSDEAYIKAVTDGDFKTAQKMVDAAAKKAMPNSLVKDANGHLLKVYHGSPNKFTVFNYNKMNVNGNAHGRGFYFTENRSYAEGYESKDGQLLEGYLNIEKPLSENSVTITKSNLIKLITATCEEQARSSVADGEYNSVEAALPDTWISNYVMTNGMDIKEAYREVANIIYSGSDNDVDMIAEITNAGAGVENTLKLTRKILKYDGVIYTNTDGNHEFVAFTSNQFKSADPVTFDDNGAVIPLSERFNEAKKDIRYSLSGYPGENVHSNMSEDVDGNGQKEYNKKRKKKQAYYSQYYSTVMQWAFSSKTKPGDIKVFYNPQDNTWNKLVAEETEDRYGTLLSIEDAPENAEKIRQLHEEVYNENYREKRELGEGIRENYERYWRLSNDLGNDNLNVTEQGANGHVSEIRREEPNSNRSGHSVRSRKDSGVKSSLTGYASSDERLAEAFAELAMTDVERSWVERYKDKAKNIEKWQEEILNAKLKLAILEGDKAKYKTEYGLSKNLNEGIKKYNDIIISREAAINREREKILNIQRAGPLRELMQYKQKLLENDLRMRYGHTKLYSRKDAAVLFEDALVKNMPKEGAVSLRIQ